MEITYYFLIITMGEAVWHTQAISTLQSPAMREAQPYPHLTQHFSLCCRGRAPNDGQLWIGLGIKSNGRLTCAEMVEWFLCSDVPLFSCSHACAFASLLMPAPAGLFPPAAAALRGCQPQGRTEEGRRPPWSCPSAASCHRPPLGT